ncbi:hypothetical protein CA606_16890 [Caulobacter vibrioides]|uniref:Sulfotransferase family protein n=1 Tax=Caulobacter vibrioides TaxID=155892 RepID=A0A290MP56_CAUVI|nr:hypothetical protein [Caulobacter vibrioides]ATC33866.1 hypothetical protein CA606_16890 [Caulobacter vibrioides]
MPPSDPTTVFIHSGWRCSSTYVWHRFRASPGVRAYYEPFHEQLARVTAETINAQTPDNSGLRHPGGETPYLREFDVVLDPAGGVRGFDPGFALDRFWIEPEASDLEQQVYVEGLVAAARERGEVPVLACCRTLGRAGWLKRRFDGFHIVLIRDPVQQWLSFYSLRRRPRPTYFELCHYVLLSEMEGCGDVSVALLGEGFEGARPLTDRIAAVRARLKRAPASVSFQAFLAVWLQSYLKALPHADLVVDVDRLARDQAYARRIETAIEDGCGLRPDFLDCRAPAPHPVSPPVAWRKAARAVVDLMNLHEAIIGPQAPPILFRKLAPAFAALTPAPVGGAARLREAMGALVGGASVARAPSKAYAATARMDGSRR